MEIIRNTASITMLSGMSSHTRREPPGKTFGVPMSGLDVAVV